MLIPNSNYFAILILFEYHDLPGIASDFRRSYEHVSRVMKIPRRNITVISDINREDDGICLKRDQDPEIPHILNVVKSLGIYHYYSNRDEFLDLLMRIFKKLSGIPDGRLFFYYSGHGRRTKDIPITCNFLLPDNSLFYSSELTMMINILQATTEVFMIIDACHAQGIIALPFKCHSGMIQYDSFVKYVSPKMILTTSCDENQWASATKDGSHFTDSVMRYLSRPQNPKDVSIVIDNIERSSHGTYTTHPGFYISEPSVRELWSWLFGFKEYPDIDVRLSSNRKIIIKGRFMKQIKMGNII